MLDFLHSNMLCEWGKGNGNKCIDMKIGYNPQFADLNRWEKKD